MARRPALLSFLVLVFFVFTLQKSLSYVVSFSVPKQVLSPSSLQHGRISRQRLSRACEGDAAQAQTCIERYSTRVDHPVDQHSLVMTPADTFQELVRRGQKNSKKSILKTLHASFMGGSYVGIGGLVSLVIGGGFLPGFTAAHPGVQRLVHAALFPINLLLVLQTESQLFTGNTVTMASGFWERKLSIADVTKNWVVSFLGNVLGCGLVALAADYTGLLSQWGAADLAVKMVAQKCSATFLQVIVKAIYGNLLVCVAVFLATMAKDMCGKMVAIWLCISAFVAIGFEHSVANMFILPAGWLSSFHASTKLPYSMSNLLMKNLLPASIGNVIAGAIVVAGGFSFSFGRLGKDM